MINIINTDQLNAYFCKGNEIVEKFDPLDKELKFKFRLGNAQTMCVPHNLIKINQGGYIYFDYDGTKYIINDGYQNNLIRAGYIVMNNYDIINIEDRKAGIKLRDDNIDLIYEALKSHYNSKSYEDCPFTTVTQDTIDSIRMTFIKDGVRFNILINTINCIVGKNQKRKSISLPYYPFRKDMDKYGCLYISVFAEKMKSITPEQDHKKYMNAQEIIEDIIRIINLYNMDKESINRFKYIPLIVRKRLTYVEGM